MSFYEKAADELAAQVEKFLLNQDDEMVLIDAVVQYRQSKEAYQDACQKSGIGVGSSLAEHSQRMNALQW